MHGTRLQLRAAAAASAAAVGMLDVDGWEQPFFNPVEDGTALLV